MLGGLVLWTSHLLWSLDWIQAPKIMNNLEHTNPEFLHEQGDDKKNLIQNIHRNLKNKLGEDKLATLASQSQIVN